MNTGYYAFQIGNENYIGNRVDYSGSGTNSANTWSYWAGVAAYDKVGDGFVDLVYGDRLPGDNEARQGYDTSLVLNENGIFRKDPALEWTNTDIAAEYENGQATPDKEVSTVDLNNDGFVDIAYRGANNLTARITGDTTTTANDGMLVLVRNDGTNSTTPGQNLNIVQIIENAMYADSALRFNGVDMTWADFNGDGFMDLFLAKGGVVGTLTENDSRIYFNDGTGKLFATNTDADPINENPSGFLDLGDNFNGGGSLAVDWNADGKMDVIEIPWYPSNVNIGTGTAQNVLLFTNTSTNALNATGTLPTFTQSTLVNIVGTAATADAITGLVAFDIDWDGDKDAMFFTGNAGTRLVTNTTTIADGTALHLRIVDQNGINALFGNTVILYDEDGNRVRTGIFNPQGGNQTNDSSGIISFYGLDPSKTYTAVMLRNVGGASQHVGGVASIGGFTIENVNAGWTGLKAGNGTSAYTLTTEAGTAVNNSNTAVGIVGTGYNDTIIATQGADTYNGAGGSTFVSDSRQWSNTGGQDIIDYKLAGNTAVTVDLTLVTNSVATATAQNTGFGIHKLVNIEGVAGANGADTFTDNAGDNLFNGRGGNDIFNLTNGGRDTLIFEALDASATGGNGVDTVNGFKVGAYLSTPNADRLDISDLLIGYTADANGPARYINGVATIDAGDTIAQYLQVQQVGADTQVWIDRDGSGGAYEMTHLLTLTNTTVDLNTLLANQQFVVG